MSLTQGDTRKQSFDVIATVKGGGASYRFDDRHEINGKDAAWVASWLIEQLKRKLEEGR